MEISEQSFLDHGVGDGELIGEAALKTDAASHAVFLSGGDDVPTLLKGVGHGFFQNQVLAGIGHRDGLGAVLARVAGDVDDLDVGIRQHRIEVGEDSDLAAVLPADFGLIQSSGGINRRDLSFVRCIDRVDVRACCPAVSDDAYVVLFHGVEKGKIVPTHCFLSMKSISVRGRSCDRRLALRAFSFSLRFGSLAFCLAGKRAGDGDAFSGLRLHIDFGADEIGSIAHDSQPDS